jgi:hypothetical protein
MQPSQVVNAVGPGLCHQQAQHLQNKEQPQPRVRVEVQEHLLQLLHQSERTSPQRRQQAAQHRCLNNYVQAAYKKNYQSRDLEPPLDQKAVYIDQLQVVQPVRTHDLVHNVQVLTLLRAPILGPPNAQTIVVCRRRALRVQKFIQAIKQH